MQITISDSLWLTLVASFYFAAGYYSFERMALLALIDEEAEPDQTFIRAVRHGEPAALVVWAVYIIAWPVLHLVAWVRYWRDHGQP